MNNYDDIINLPHPEPKNHTRMSIESRSAQFAPFAALTGHNDAIKETERLTTKRIELSDNDKELINNKLLLIDKLKSEKPLITFTYFIYDNKKNGGKYVNITGIVKRIDLINSIIYLTNNVNIPIEEIIDINADIFNIYE